MNKKLQFIYTSDEETRNNLVKLGFSEIPSGNSFFIFVNDSNLKFDDSVKLGKICFTNKLTF